jgi:hypothetical protein
MAAPSADRSGNNRAAVTATPPNLEGNRHVAHRLHARSVRRHSGAPRGRAALTAGASTKAEGQARSSTTTTKANVKKATKKKAQQKKCRYVRRGNNVTRICTVGKGAQRTAGATGATGAKGDQGDKGEKGDAGEKGAGGEKGLKGDNGTAGAKGENGTAGATGENGTAGTAGATGATGGQGIQGIKGDPGAQGVQGPSGLLDIIQVDSGPLWVAPNSGRQLYKVACPAGRRLTGGGYYTDIAPGGEGPVVLASVPAGNEWNVNITGGTGTGSGYAVWVHALCAG